MKICLMGSAPSSAPMAPFDNPEWKIWACSPGSVAHLKRVDAFFEVHRWEPNQPWFNIEYRAWLATRECPVYMIHPIECVPKSVAYPKDEMLAKFGPFFFTSSLSWMFALAIHQGATEISLVGVDMSAQEEWEFQRSGCHYFISLARNLGIKVHVPPESDLLEPPPLYGFREVDAMHIKLLSRTAELQAHVRKAEMDVNEATQRMLFFKGALENNNYVIKTWVSDPLANAMSKWNPGQPLPAHQQEVLARMQPPPLMAPVEDLKLDVNEFAKGLGGITDKPAFVSDMVCDKIDLRPGALPKDQHLIPREEYEAKQAKLQAAVVADKEAQVKANYYAAAQAVQSLPDKLGMSFEEIKTAIAAQAANAVPGKVNGIGETKDN